MVVAQASFSAWHMLAAKAAPLPNEVARRAQLRYRAKRIGGNLSSSVQNNVTLNAPGHEKFTATAARRRPGWPRRAEAGITRRGRMWRNW